MSSNSPDLTSRLQRLLTDSDHRARPSHILRAIESSAVSLTGHAQENLSDLIEWLQAAESVAAAGKLASATGALARNQETEIPEEDEDDENSLTELNADVPESTPRKKATPGKKPSAKSKKPKSVHVGPPPPGEYPVVRLFIDGGARGNPGPAAIGLVMEDDGEEVIWTHAEGIGSATNNFAEYTALIHGLREAKRLRVQHIEVFSDSELIVKQTLGQYQVKHPALVHLWEEARQLSKQFARFRIAHVPRAKNKVADQLLNQALDEERNRA